MKIAVTSASGKLGSAIVKKLIEEIGKDNIIAIARTPEKANHLGVEVRKGDYNNPEDFELAFKDTDTVLLVSGMDDPSKRIQQHRNVIEGAKKNKVRKIVYTSIIGDEKLSGFKPIVQSNRQTEKDIIESGLEWVIGRNGIYIEPDLEYIDHYIKDGGIHNSAGEGKCAYTSRTELAQAYSKLILNNEQNNEVCNLSGEAISQQELATLINQHYKTKLSYTPLSIEAYKKERVKALGEFMGTVIAGIYEGIRLGANEVHSDFEKVTGRQHKTPTEMIEEFQAS